MRVWGVGAAGPRVTVAIIDDHPMSAEGLTARLVAVGIDVVAWLRDVESYVPGAGLPRVPDVVVCDLRLPGLSLSRAVARLARQGCRVLAMSGRASPDIVLEAVAHGARGYLRKDNPAERFTEAVMAVATVGYHVSPYLAVCLRDDLRCRPLHPDLEQPERELLNACADGNLSDELTTRTGIPAACLPDSFARVFEATRRRRHDPRYRPTPKEEEVMTLAGCAGMNNRRIAQQLGGISPETITTHLAHLKEKYRRTHPDDGEAAGMSPRAIAGLWARDLGLCEFE